MDALPPFLGSVPKWADELRGIWSRHKTEFDALPRQYQRGRRVGRVPSGPTDVVAGDQKWDVSNDGTYEYTLLETSAGVLKWDRRTLNVAW